MGFTKRLYTLDREICFLNFIIAAFLVFSVVLAFKKAFQLSDGCHFLGIFIHLTIFVLITAGRGNCAGIKAYDIWTNFKYVCKILLLFFLVITISCMGHIMSPEIAIRINVATTAVAFVVSVFILNQLLPVRVKDITPEYKIARWLKKRFTSFTCRSFGDH